MMTQALEQFRTEITSFYVVSLLNLVVAALVMAFGITYIVTAIAGTLPDPGMPLLRIFTGIVAMVCFGLGLSWLLSSLEVFEGLESIRDVLCSEGAAISDERTTCLMVRMLAHYRDKRETVRRMILACTAGGVCFFLLGIASSLEFLEVTRAGMGFTLNNFLLIPSMLLTLGIALASLLSTYYFTGFTKTWDERLHEIDESECALKKTLGLDEP